MRQLTGFVFVLIFLAFAISCDNGENSSNGEDVSNENTVITNNDNLEENTTDLSEVQAPENVELRCLSMGEDEASGGPKNDVILVVDGKEQKIATILACETIPVEDYERHEIPVGTKSACGGWWAGGGEYFYARIEQGEVSVYRGWQDEGQEDAGYHWKKMDLSKKVE